MFDKVLTSLGLSPDQSLLYLSLLEKGPQSAIELSRSTGIKRTYIYALAKSLISHGLVQETKKGRTTLFAPLSPDHLLTLAQNQQQQVVTALSTLENILPNLKSQFTAQETRPVITYFEGLEGIKKIYADITREGKDIILFRSVHDHDYPEMAQLIDRQIARQVQAGIKTRTITPLELKYTRYTYLKLDKTRLVSRHVVPPNTLQLPSQILIYGPKVAIISFKTALIGMVIDNRDLAQTLTLIFNLIWQQTQDIHQQITSKWTTPGPNPYLKPIPPYSKRKA